MTNQTEWYNQLRFWWVKMSHRQGQSWPEGFLIKVIQVHAQQAAMHQLNTEKPPET